MSHFSVIVVTKTKPDEGELHKILLPWHEYECTGFEEHVVDVDVTDQVRAYSEERRECVKLADGSLDWSHKYKKLPDGATTVEVTEIEFHKTMDACARSYFGESVIVHDGRYYNRTNPQKKWDWWVVGGRWTGMLVPRYDPAADPDNKRTCVLCQGTGRRDDHADPELRAKCNGCDGTGVETKWPTQWKKIVGDQMMLRDVPLIALRDEAERRALARHDRATAIVAGRPIPDFAALRETHGVEKAREIYNFDSVVVDLREAEVLDFFDDIKDFTHSRADVARRARAGALCPFAVVHEGKWHERGSMGWWGVVHDEKDPDRWADEFAKLLDGLPSETWLTVVDCHI